MKMIEIINDAILDLLEIKNELVSSTSSENNAIDKLILQVDVSIAHYEEMKEQMLNKMI